MSGSKINNAVTVSVTLGTTSGQGVYISPLTITASGEIAPTTPGATALSVAIAVGYVLNQGTVLGAKGSIGNAASVAGNGGTGIYLTAGSVSNHGSIVGGIGGYGAYQNLPGNGGTGVVLNGGTLNNNGTIAGGLEGYGGNQVAPVSVGTGVVLLNGSLTNIGTITGGVGVRITAGNMANAGTISGRSAGIEIVAGTVTNVGMIDSVGGPGVTLTGGMLINSGGVGGGVGSPGYFVPMSYLSYRMIPGGTGAAAIEISSGTVINDGTITGGIGGPGGTLDTNGIPLVGEGGAGGYGISLVSGDLTNNGTIIGGAGGSGGTPGAGGVGVAFRAGGTLIDGGPISGGNGNGGVAHAISFGTGASRLILAHGASFTGAVVADDGFSNVLEFASTGSTGMVIGLGDSITGFGTLQFDPGAAWLVAGNTVGLADGQSILGFSSGDTIELAGFVETAASFTAAGLVLAGIGGPETLGIQGAFTTSDFIVTNDGANSFVELACFAAGTRISTEHGLITVEDLRAGDRLRVLHGQTLKPVTWIGQRHVDCARYPKPDAVWPVRVSAGALGPDQPFRDLFLSPDHALFIEGVLIPVRYLVNGRTIRQEARDAIEYWHVELAEHNVLYAEGVPAESYLDTGNRSAFVNGGAAVALHPDFASRAREAHTCAPLVVTGPLLDAVRQCLNRPPPEPGDADGGPSSAVMAEGEQHAGSAGFIADAPLKSATKAPTRQMRRP